MEMETRQTTGHRANCDMNEAPETTAPIRATPPWHAAPIERVLADFSSSPQGLSAVEATRRLAQQGPNVLKEGKPISPWSIFLSQFKSLIIWILIVAGVISAALGEAVDAIAILAIVVLNAIIGFYQEFSAEKSIAALKKMTAPHAKVRRDGKIHDVPASEVVPGDLIAFEAGDLIAADARLLEAASLKCIEAALTGESEAVEKNPETLKESKIPLGDRVNMVFTGTSVAAGQGCAVVVATGMDTEIGHIAGLIEQAAADEGTPLQQKLQAFGRVLVWASLGIVALLFVLGLVRGIEFLELFLTSVSLAVAAVPEGLPAVVTVALALGVMRMARRRALVRRLPAVETLGSTTVICTDKTGTLTVGQMTVRELYVSGRTYEVAGDGYAPEGKVMFGGTASGDEHAGPLLELATVLVGSNNAELMLEDGVWRVSGDPTEGALLAAGYKAGANREEVQRAWPKRHEIPFDSDRKRRTVVRRMANGRLRAFINGAPDLLLARCTSLYTDQGIRPLTARDRDLVVQENVQMAGRALRVLGSAYRDLDDSAELSAEAVETDLVFVGLSGMYDPPRAEAKDAVGKCRSAGIRVVMITGDHPRTALAIARELGIAEGDDAALTGLELDNLSDSELAKRAPQVPVYARVTAAHKLRIVRAWKDNKAVVAMTGDGVNDAPAIKGADIGIAMGRSGTEVTKQASDMVITDDNFATIVAAVEQGRGIYDNIRNTLQYLLAGNCGELILMTACIVVGLPIPLLPIHLLWINLVTDGLPALCLATDPIDADVMERPPRATGERLAGKGFLGMMLLTGLLTAGVALGVYIYGLKTETLEMARSHAFAALVFAELLRSFGARSDTKPVWRISLLANLNLTIVVALSFALQLASHYFEPLARLFKATTIRWSDCLMLILVSLIPLAALEIVKLCRAKQLRSAV